MTDLFDLFLTYILTRTFIGACLVIFLGFLLRYTLIYCRQLWVASFHQSMTFMILPVTTYMITKVISGNIALSLGMVGALSIVRFRNPVKNSFELIMFFVLIAVGITATAMFKYSILLTFLVIFIITFSRIIEKYYYEKKNKKLFSFSFNEGEKVSTLEFESKNIIPSLKDNEFLIQEINDLHENLHIYKFASHRKEDMKKLSLEIRKHHSSDIKNIEYVSN